MDKKILNKGGWISLLIGLPFGISFILFVSYISLFSPITQFIFIAVGSSFWLYWPLIVSLFTALFCLLLWHTGKQSVKDFSLNKGSLLQRSTKTSLFINTILFAVIFGYILVMWSIGQGVWPPLLLGTVFILYGVAVIFSSFTFCLLTNYIIRRSIIKYNIYSVAK
jgi:hypothetical protein